MSLDVYIKYKKPKKDNYFLSHPYYYSNLSDADKKKYYEEECWSANITHNLGKMALKIPVGSTSLYMAVWRPEEILKSPTTNVMLTFLVKGINYMVSHRKELLPFEPDNGWGTYDGFMKFLLDYKNACEDNPDCLIEIYR